MGHMSFERRDSMKNSCLAVVKIQLRHSPDTEKLGSLLIFVSIRKVFEIVSILLSVIRKKQLGYKECHSPKCHW